MHISPKSLSAFSVVDVKHTFTHHKTTEVQTMGRNILYLTTYDHLCKQRLPLSTIESPLNYKPNFPRKYSIVFPGRSLNER